MSHIPAALPAHPPRDRGVGRRILITSAVLHFTNDACFALLYPLLPLIAADLGLSYAQVGLVRAAFSGAASTLQFPAGLLGERFGEGLILLLGNLWVGGGVAALALAGGFAGLLALALLAGLGGNALHPLGSTLVSRSAAPARTATGLGTFNLAGDLGKLVAPLAAGVAVGLGWRAPLVGVGAATAALALTLLLRHAAVLPPLPVPPLASASCWPPGALDSATQGAALTVAIVPVVLPLRRTLATSR
jgi:MFS family permease